MSLLFYVVMVVHWTKSALRFGLVLEALASSTSPNAYAYAVYKPCHRQKKAVVDDTII